MGHSIVTGVMFFIWFWTSHHIGVPIQEIIILALDLRLSNEFISLEKFYCEFVYFFTGKTQEDINIILDTFQDILIRRRKNLSQQKILAFTKRLGTLSLQNHQHATLAVMALIKSVLQVGTSIFITFFLFLMALYWWLVVLVL